MKAKDFIQMVEYTKGFKDKPRRRRREIDFTDIDLTLLMHKKLEEADALKKLIEDHHKIHKKEEKKEEKKWPTHQIAMFLVLTFPITAPMYVWYIKALLQ